MSDRHAILIIAGNSSYDSLGSFNREVARIIATMGLDPVILDLLRPEVFNEQLKKALHQYPGRIGAAISFSGIGVEVGDGSETGNLWQALRIPMLNYLLDHPCYLLSRHKHPAPAIMRLYPSRDFLDFQRDYVRAPHRTVLCPLGVMSYGRQPVSRQPKTNEIPLIIFPKSALNPKVVEESWKLLPRMMQSVIRDAIDHYWGKTTRSGSVVNSVLTAADAAGIELRNDLTLFTFFVAQLDDYIRRSKADLLFRQLLPMPIRIYGQNLDYLDTEGARAEIMSPIPYDELLDVVAQSLAVISMNPNTDDGGHDRIFMALGAGALPITDANPYWDQHCPGLMPYNYDFRDRSLSGIVEKVLTDPVTAADVAWKQSQLQYKKRTFDMMVRDMLELALMHRYFTFNFQPPQPYYIKSGD